MLANFRKGSHVSAATKKKIGRAVKAAWRKKHGAKKTARKTVRRTHKTTARKTVRRAGARRQTAAQRRASLRNLRKARAARKGVRRTTKSKGRKSSVRRSSKRRTSLHMNTAYVANGRRRRSRRHVSLAHLVRNGRKHRKSRRHSRRGYSSNAFMSDLLATLKTGAVVGAGFLAHRLITNLLVDYVLEPNVVSKITDANTKSYVQIAEKPVVGLVVLGLGLVAGNALFPKMKMEVGAGMVASLIQQIVITGLTAAKQTVAAKEISGYSSSLAYSLHGAFEHNANSIMPQYASVNGMGEYFTPMGDYTQAAAGMGEYFQAAAGLHGDSMGAAFQQAAAGTGEYFAPNGLKGIGDYEAAGEEAMLPSGAPSVITDGIRPDSNLDRELDLMEAAAGLHGRRGVGEYITARPSNGGYAESVVGQQSQWVPNGPMWAGTLKAQDTSDTSEIPAGILASNGGNGTLSS